MDIVFYILVESTTAGWSLYSFLKEQGCVSRIAPVPRGLQACCGMSLLVKAADMDAVRVALESPDAPDYVDIVQMENQYNARRDVYC